MKKSLTKKLFAGMVLGLSAMSAWAVMPEAGNVYRIVNITTGNVVSDRGPAGNVGTSAVNDDNMSQRWRATAGPDGTINFQSLGTGMYLSSPNESSQPWRLSSKTNFSTQLVVSAVEDFYTVSTVTPKEYGYMHRNDAGNVVCWEVGSNINSRWDFTKIEMTQAEIDAALKKSQNMEAEVKNEAAYQTALDKLFDNKQCTTLKSNYQAMSDDAIKADANFKALSAPLQAMVLKVKNGNWAENTNGTDWDSEHALKYRVQSYEPFSEGAEASALAGIQAYTNMNNPTGILGYTGNVLYVMVQNVPDDENVTLHISGAVGSGMFNNVTDGTALHEGLNIVPQWGDCAHQYIYYTIKTTKNDANGKRVPNVKVTDYKPIQIHIEGGDLNGYFNFKGDELYKADTWEDYKYTSVRAKHEMYDLLGEYVILHFHLFDTPSKPGQANSPGMLTLLNPETNPQNPNESKYEWDPTIIMKTWDDLCFRERTVMGIQLDSELKAKSDLVWNFYEPLTGDDVADPGFQYGDYMNNRMMGITMQGDLYMNATTWRTAYNINTMKAILNTITNNAGANWGPAHEYGHMNQTPMKFAGTTEESNNIFSNVVVYYHGTTTSRADKPSDQLNIFNRDRTYLEHNTWGTTRMFLQLWLYYHACGHNKKFYPRLYELLRQNPRQQSYYLNMRYDQCHFAKMCCIAAQEDLTDYFESWGFFVPVKNYHIGDYSNWMATLTPEDAQAVKDEIKALNLPKNDQIILIDDRPGSKRESWADYMAIKDCGPMGGIEDFRNNVQPSGELSFTLDGNKLVVDSVKGKGGVGFLIYGADGTLLSFSNDYTFPLKNAAIAAIMAGTAKVYAVGADGTKVEVANNYINAPIADHQKNLEALVKSVVDVYNLVDEEGLRANWFTPAYAKDFLAAYAAANEAIASDKVSKETITELYFNLLNEYNALKSHSHARVRFIPSSKYQIINAQYPTRALATAAKLGKASAADVKLQNTPESQIWNFVKAGNADDQFLLQHVSSKLYLGAIDNSLSKDEIRAKIPTVSNKNEAGIFTLRAGENGDWMLLNGGDDAYSIHIGQNNPKGPLMQYDSSAGASKWYLRLIEPNVKGALTAKLEQLLAESKDLLAKAGEINIEGSSVELTPEMYFSNAKCTNTKFGDEFTGFDVLCDNNSVTFMHTNYGAGNTEDGQNHHIGIDLGEGKSLSSIQINWLNRDTQGSNGAVTNPVAIDVQGSNDKKTWKTLASLGNLPSASGAAYTSPVITDGTDYRYFRIVCTQGAGNDGWGHQYFALAELGIGEAIETIIPDKAYPAVTPDMMVNVRSVNQATDIVLSKNQSNKTLQAAYDTLLAAYTELANAMGIELGSINEITADSNRPAAEGIYDLQGRKLNKAGKTGVYIIDGEKTLVK